MVGLVLTGIYR